MTTEDFHTASAHPFRTAPVHADAELPDLTAPYAGQTRMQLTLGSGLADARLRIDPAATQLIAIDHGEGIRPRLRASAGTLRVSWPMTIGAWLRAALAGTPRDVEIVLHPAVEWSIQIRGGLSHVDVDLAAGKLARLEISGGVSVARIDLPAPTAVVPIRIAGGASDLGVRRPAAIGLALAVGGGVAALRLDDQELGAVGGGLRLAAGDVTGATPRYALEISGGASGLHVVRA